MNVSEIMTARPVSIRPESTLRKALEVMEKIGCHHLPVISSSRHLVGILSDRDCRTALNSPYTMHEHWQDESLIDHLLVRNIMTPAPIVTEPDSFVNEAAQVMLENHINCLPVMRAETLVGIITTSDIMAAFVRMYSSTPALPKPQQ